MTHSVPAALSPTETHPRPPKPDPVKNVSGVLSGLAPAKSAPVINNGSPTILGKRSYEQHNGVDGESGGLTSSARGPGAPGPGPAPPMPTDCVFSPLSCRRALPGNVKKRLLMPSRGKARGAAGVVALPALCAEPVCAVLTHARQPAQGTSKGSPRGLGRALLPPFSRFTCHSAEI